MCLFGCRIKTTNMGQMYTHYKQCHSQEVLAKWGINKDILDIQDPGDRTLSDNYIQEKLAKQQAPRLKCEERAPERHFNNLSDPEFYKP